MGKITKILRFSKSFFMSKKGIFFTLIAISIMIVFLVVSTPQADISLQKDTQALRTRLTYIDSYVSDLEQRYLETTLRATTYKTILSLIFYMNSTGDYIANLDSAFYEVMVTGKINGIPIDTTTGKKIMENNTLTDWIDRVVQTSKDTLRVNTTIAINNVSVFQTTPWNIDSMLSVNFTVNSSVAEWKKVNVIVTTSISIAELPDPYYLVNTDGAYTNMIKSSSINQWNISHVREHLRNGTYVHWPNSEAPSFLMRFTNTIINSSCCGIESLVNPNRIVSNDQTESYVDYLFWAHKYLNNCTQLYNITGLWDEFRYFKLDLVHVNFYNITAQDAVGNC